MASSSAAATMKRESSDPAADAAAASASPSAAARENGRKEASSKGSSGTLITASITAHSTLAHLSQHETQLVMQLLDTKSLLLLARCGRRLQQDARGALAWQGKPPFRLHFSSHHLPALSTLVLPPLLRLHAAFSVDFFSPELSEAEFESLLSIPRITELHLTTGKSPSLAQWERLSAQPWTAGLRCLKVHLSDFGVLDDHGPNTSLPAALLTNCTQLEQLDVETEANSALAAATLSSRLRSLAVCDSPPASLSITHVIQQRTQLTDLTLIAPQLCGARFREFFTAPNLAQLQRLHLKFFRPAKFGPVAVEDYAAAFSALTQLQHVSFTHFGAGSAALVSQLPHCPSLRVVRLHSTRVAHLPSLFVLLELLLSRPAVHLQLRASEVDADGYAQEQQCEQLAQWAYMRINERFSFELDVFDQFDEEAEEEE